MNSKEHWEIIYESKGDPEVSWTQSEPEPSLSLIREVAHKGRIIDVGGGTSVLVDRLLALNYSVTALDISKAAIARAQVRLGECSSLVRWIVADVTTNLNLDTVDVWHDRAVFHFLTNLTDRAAYVGLMSRTVISGGYIILATFALDGPEKCSGLPVQRYDGSSLAAELGEGFSRIKTVPAIHKTPSGHPQSFQYSIFRKL